MLVDTIFYFYGVKIMKNINNKGKLVSLFKDLNFNVSELKSMYNKYNSPLKFSEFISYYEELVTRMNFLYNYIKKLEELVEIKSDSLYNINARLDNYRDNIDRINTLLSKSDFLNLFK